VVLGEPVAVKPPRFGVLRQTSGAREGVSRGAALHDGGEIENRDGDHALSMRAPCARATRFALRALTLVRGMGI